MKALIRTSLISVAAVILLGAFYTHLENQQVKPALAAASIDSAKVYEPASYSPIGLVAACGAAASHRVIKEDGEFYQKFTYPLDGDSTVVVTFKGAGVKGPWTYANALHFGGEAGILTKANEALPCLNNAH